MSCSSSSSSNSSNSRKRTSHHQQQQEVHHRLLLLLGLLRHSLRQTCSSRRQLQCQNTLLPLPVLLLLPLRARPCQLRTAAQQQQNQQQQQQGACRRVLRVSPAVCLHTCWLGPLQCR
jgi:hypothetical protein